MADKSKEELPDNDQQSAETATPRGGRLAALGNKLFTRKWLAIILAVSVGVHAVGFACYKLSSQAVRDSDAEVSLGEFSFTTLHPAPGQVAEATFSLHLALIGELDRLARQRLHDRAFRVEQDIEELLRRAHGSDFDDPALAELKHQLQEQIDRTLELRAIADVIITDLEFERTREDPPSISETVETLPWGEPPAG
jgi:flagellar basal body-associated protein FliL